MLLELIDAGAVMEYYIRVKDKNLLFPLSHRRLSIEGQTVYLRHHNAKPGCRQTKNRSGLSPKNAFKNPASGMTARKEQD
jgi:hypothetical protein